MNPTKTIQRQIQHNKRARPGRQRQMRTYAIAVISGIILALLITTVPTIIITVSGLPKVSIPPLTAGIQIFDYHDRKICTIFSDRDQEPVPLNHISDNLKKAVIAAEDHNFYQHDGINPISVLRAILADIGAGRPIQGGSTISQQLVKNLYFEGKKRNLLDKLAEALMAIDMENKYSKEKILEGYLNHIYFGNGVYGAQRAAEYYFGKQAINLNIAESCYLAALINRPSELSLSRNRAQAIARQKLILNSMKQLRLANAEQITQSSKNKLLFRSIPGASQKYRYYTNAVLEQCRQEFGDEIFAGSNTDNSNTVNSNAVNKALRVYTNLDPVAQALAEKTLSSGIKHAPAGINQGALISISVADGAIIAMVGGAGPYANNQWNRSINPHTAGSAFKPFVYLAALSQATLHPDDLVTDAPLTIKEPGAAVYQPRNYDGQYLGDITIRKALALSRNTPAVRVAQQVGPETLIHYARQAGITSQLDANLSLALGSSAISPLEMANAYATLARNGEYLSATIIRRITDQQGKVLKIYSQERHQAFDNEPVAEIVDALQDVVEKGTGTRAQLFDRPVAGKTGTSDKGKDVWFVGFTPDLVTAVWGGNDNNKPVFGHVSGGSVMAGIWQNYMRDYYHRHQVPAGSFMPPLHPLMEEPEPLHLIPEPAGIFQRFFFGSANEAPPLAPDRTLTKIPQPRKKPGLFKKLLRWLDF